MSQSIHGHRKRGPLDLAAGSGLRGPVIGRRNHFGSKSARGTAVAAILFARVKTVRPSSLIIGNRRIVVALRGDLGCFVVTMFVITACGGILRTPGSPSLR